MADRLQWIFEIFDKASAPARAIEKALKGIEKALHAGAGALHTLHDGLHVLESVAHGFEFVSEKAGELLEKLRFKEASLIALEALTGTRDAAIDMWEQTHAFASRTGQSFEQLIGIAKDLRSGGFGAQEIGVLQQALSDVGVAFGTERMNLLAEALANMGRAGHLGARELMAVKHAGLSTEDVTNRLQALFGMDPAAMKKAIEGGRVGAKDAAFAIFKSIEQGISHGQAGSLAKKMAETLPGAIGRVKLIPEELIEGLAGFGQGGLKGALSSVFTNIADAFAPDSASGQRILARLRELLDRVAGMLGIGTGKNGLLGDLAGPNGVAKVEEIFDRMIDAIERALPALQAIGKAIVGIGSGIKFIGDAASGLGGALGAALYGGSAPSRNAALPEGTAEGWKKAQEAARAAGLPTMLMADDAMRDQGIDAGQALGEGVKYGAMTALQIHSPSKVFEQLGEMTALGFGRGLDAGGLDFTSGRLALSTPSLDGLKGGKSVALTIQVDARGEGAEGIAERVRHTVVEALGGAFEELALQSGVA